jgi:hypothetical protein
MLLKSTLTKTVAIIILLYFSNMFATDSNCSNLLITAIDKKNMKITIKNVGTDSIYLGNLTLYWSQSWYLKTRCDWNSGILLGNNMSSMAIWFKRDSLITLPIQENSINDTNSIYHVYSTSDPDECKKFTIINTTDINGGLVDSCTCGKDTIQNTIYLKNHINKATLHPRKNKIELKRNGISIISDHDEEYNLLGIKKIKRKQ